MVVDDPDEAARLAGEGRNVVLVVPEGGPVVDLAALPAGAGRVAVFVGPPADPTVRVAAQAMAEELFGPDRPG